MIARNHPSYFLHLLSRNAASRQVVARLSSASSEGGRAAAGLPCLSSNISNESRGPDSLEPLLQKDFEQFNILTKAHKRSACSLAWNIQNMAETFGLERLGFLTLTFADNVTCPKEAQRRFNSLTTGVLRDRYEGWIWVWERTKRGRIHFHLVVVLKDDIRTGFDFLGVEVNDYRSANAAIRAEWAFWRKTAKNYGFGRTELLPVKSTAEGIARYVGKYISKHIGQREERDKGCKLVGYSRNVRMATAKFSFASEGARQWRLKVAAYAKMLGALGATPDRSPLPFDQFKYVRGPRWAFNDRSDIAAMPLLYDKPHIHRLHDSETGEVLQVVRLGDGTARLL